MKKAEAQIKIEINLNCPHCDEFLDLLNEDEFPNLNDEGYLNRKLLGESFGCENFNEKVTCPKCKEEFEVFNVWW